MLVSLKALEKPFTSEIRRMLYLRQNMKVPMPRPSGREQWYMRETVMSMRAIARAKCKAVARTEVSEMN